MDPLRLCSYNIHKGLSQFNRRLAIHELRERLHLLSPDILLLQEVQGLHLGHSQRFVDWPLEPQHEFLARNHWHAAYGGNAHYAQGHHGNAILSRLPILSSDNHDVTLNRLEYRGLLHCRLALPAGEGIAHAICVHLSLTERQRQRQLDSLCTLVEQHIPVTEPLIIAGDFNDWQLRASRALAKRLGLIEAFTAVHGHPARSFPSKLPVLRLDRIYLRGWQASEAKVYWGQPWSRISDHAALCASVRKS
jgi:endonuclease/exonuclease/phosphatase family metal-dependent hydrolase